MSEVNRRRRTFQSLQRSTTRGTCVRDSRLLLVILGDVGELTSGEGAEESDARYPGHHHL